MIKKFVLLLILALIVALVYFYYLPKTERNDALKLMRSKLPEEVKNMVDCTPLSENDYVKIKKHAVYQWTDENGQIHYGDVPPATLKTKDVSDKFDETKVKCNK